MNKIPFFFSVIMLVSCAAIFAQQKNDTTFYDQEKKMIRRLTLYQGKKKTVKDFYQEGVLMNESVWVDDKLESEITWFKDGKKRRDVVYKNGNKQKVQEWFTGGLVSRIENYKTIKEDDKEKTVLHGEYVENFQSGNKKVRGIYKEGKKDGVWSGWYESGTKKDAVTYKDGYKNGLSEYWFQNGNKGGEYEYTTITVKDRVREVKHGKWIRWEESGKKLEETTYSYDKKNGMFLEWYNNGKKKSEIEYKNDYVNGTYKTWFETGGVKMNAWYIQELDSVKNRINTIYNGKFEEYYDNGNLKAGGTYINGEKDGKWVQYHNNGQISAEQTYVKGLVNGKETHWNSSGKKIMEQTSAIIEKNGKKVSVTDGEKVFYHDNGQPRFKATFKLGVQTGMEQQWYSNGNKLDEVNYCEGKRCGKYRSWYENGNPKEERNYILKKEKDSIVSVTDGEQKQFNENGQLTRADLLYNGKIGIRSTEFHDDGKIRSVLFHFMTSEYGHVFFGPGFYWFKNGKPESESFYFNGRQVGRVLSYYVNGNIKSIIDLGFNGEKTGYELQFDQEGEVLSARKYSSHVDFSDIKDVSSVKKMYDSVTSRPAPSLKLSGSENGKWLTWFAPGKKQFEGEFVNEKLQGKFIAYYPDGKKLFEGELKDGILNGPFTVWQSNGKALREGVYTMGEQDGVFVYYFPNGNKDRELKYSLGLKNSLYTREWFPDGKPKSEIQYNAEGKQHGITKSWNDKGVLTLEVEFDNGKLIGPYKSYYEDGVIRSVKNYRDGLEHGETIDYYEKSGKKRYSTFYVGGKKHGPSYQWWENGKMKAQGIYKNDERDSLWVLYNEDGMEKSRTLYRMGVVQREATGFECECIDSTKRKIGFAPLLNQLASLQDVHDRSFNFHAPVGDFYNSLFYIGMQNSSGQQSAFYTMDVVAYQPVYIKVPDEKGIKLVFNPCVQTGSLESRINMNVDIEYGDKKSTRVTVYPKKMSIEFPGKLLSQWDSKNNEEFKSQKNEPVPASVLFNVKEVRYNSQDLLAISGISSVCFPKSQIGNTGLLLDFENFFPDLNAAATPSEIDYLLPSLYYKDSKTEKSLKFFNNSPDEFTGIFVPEGKITLPEKFLAERLKTVTVNCTGLMISSGYLVGTVRFKAEPATGTGYIIKTDAGLCNLSAIELENKFRNAGFNSSKVFFDTEKSELILYFSYRTK